MTADMNNLKPGDKLEALVEAHRPYGPTLIKGNIYTVRSVDKDGDPILTVDPSSERVGWDKTAFLPAPEESRPADDRNMRIILAKDMAEQFDPETMEWDCGHRDYAFWTSQLVRVNWENNTDKPIVVRDKAPEPVSLAKFIHRYRDSSPVMVVAHLAQQLIEAGYATEYPRSES